MSIYGFPVPGSSVPGNSPVIRHKASLTEFHPQISADKPILFQHYLSTVQTHGNRPFLGSRFHHSDDTWGPYQWKTWAQVDESVQRFSAALRKMDFVGSVLVENQLYETFGIMSASREEWVVTDLACQRQSVTLVPLADKGKIEDLLYIAKQTGLRTIACSASCLKAVIRIKAEGIESLKNLIVWEDNFDPADQSQAALLGLNVFRFSATLITVSPIPDRLPKPSDIYCICYTSGTTGKPKGVIITHAMLLAEAATLMGTVVEIRLDDVVFSYLPLQHIYERDIYAQVIVGGACYAFSHGDPEAILEDMYILRPTVCAMVPRVLNKIYDLMQAQVDQYETNHKQVLMAVLNEKVSKKVQSHEADYVFADLKSQFGGRIRGMVSSSAPLRGEVLDFFTAVMSAPLLECYGMTEVTGIAAMTQEGAAVQGQVGSPTINVEMKLVDLPDLGYVTSDPKRLRGEICFRGPLRTPGYFSDPVRTLEAIDSEGWMHSGDVGELTAQGCFRIIDRVKHFFKLSQGIYIAPEKLESIYRLSRMISQVFITGRSIEDYIVAVVVPDFKYLARSFPGKTEKEICGLKLSKQAILTDMLALARKYRLSKLQRPKQIYLETEPFSIANGILNATQKFMRHAAEKKYQEIVDALYKEGPLPIEDYRKSVRHRL